MYFLGDLSFKKDTALIFFLKFTNIEIHLIIGNHDHTNVIKLAEKYCKSISQLKEIQIEGQQIILCHYALRVWNKSHYNAWQLHGHSHGILNPLRYQYDVGIDYNNFYPLSFQQLKSIMNLKKNDVNCNLPK